MHHSEFLVASLASGWAGPWETVAGAGGPEEGEPDISSSFSFSLMLCHRHQLQRQLQLSGPFSMVLAITGLWSRCSFGPRGGHGLPLLLVSAPFLFPSPCPQWLSSPCNEGSSAEPTVASDRLVSRQRSACASCRSSPTSMT